MSQISLPASSTGLAKLLASEKYSDLKLLCQGQEIKVHKAIVCTQSPVFAAACDGNFQEATTNTINIDGFDVETVNQMLAFMYGEDYNGDAMDTRSEDFSDIENRDPETASSGNEASTLVIWASTLLRHVKVNAIADYYGVLPLKELANANIQRILETNWCAESFPAAVEEVINSTGDTALLKMVTLAAAAHIDELIELEDFAASKLMTPFAIGVMREMVKTYKAREAYDTLRIRDAERQLTYYRMVATNECNRAGQVINNIESCIGNLNRNSVCQNVYCGAPFNSYIERGGHSDEPHYTLRCACCQCRYRGN